MNIKDLKIGDKILIKDGDVYYSKTIAKIADGERFLWIRNNVYEKLKEVDEWVLEKPEKNYCCISYIVIYFVSIIIATIFSIFYI